VQQRRSVHGVTPARREWCLVRFDDDTRFGEGARFPQKSALVRSRRAAATRGSASPTAGEQLQQAWCVPGSVVAVSARNQADQPSEPGVCPPVAISASAASSASSTSSGAASAGAITSVSTVAERRSNCTCCQHAGGVRVARIPREHGLQIAFRGVEVAASHRVLDGRQRGVLGRGSSGASVGCAPLVASTRVLITPYLGSGSAPVNSATNCPERRPSGRYA